MNKTLICKSCEKTVKVNKYQIKNPVDYTCAKCRGIKGVTLLNAKIKGEELKAEVLK